MAERLTLHLFKQEKSSIVDFSEGLRSLTKLRACSTCFHIAEGDTCSICMDPHRDQSLLCIVEEPMDVIAIERTGNYRGLYHVLGGTMDAAPKKQPNRNLHIEELLRRIHETPPSEIIFAMNPTTEGDMTTLYLRRKIETPSITISRLGRGLSSGGDIEYADESTLGSALTRREKLSS